MVGCPVRDSTIMTALASTAHVPIVIGSNRDEGRTFQQGAIGWTKAQYVA
jgi:hypothetical protein